MKIFVRFIIVAAAKTLYWMCFFFGFKFCSRIGGIVGLIAYYLVYPSRKIALENISLAFPEYSEMQVRKIARMSFVNQGRNLLELFKFPSLSKEKIDRFISFPGRQNLDEALSRDKGVLYLTGHFGNWELMGASLSIWGYPINVIARKIYLEYLNNLLVSLREKVGMKVILRAQDGSPRDILKALRKNEVIGILIDQDTNVPGVFVDFFGRKAYTPAGLAAIALRSGAAVSGGFLVRDGDRHVLEVSRPVQLVKTGDKQKDISANTQIFTKILEDIIRKHPEQWVWMHDRWKTKET